MPSALSPFRVEVTRGPLDHRSRGTGHSGHNIGSVPNEYPTTRAIYVQLREARRRRGGQKESSSATGRIETRHPQFVCDPVPQRA
jgi:hypothetical protein